MVDEMACQELVERVTAYLEEALPPADRARFDAHLAECRGCRTYLEQIRKTITMVGTVGDGAIPPAVEQNLLAMFRNWKAKAG